MLLNLEMCTPLWLESAGHNFLGQAISEQIRQSLSGLSTDTTLIVSCAKSSGMVRITVDSPKPSPCKPTSPSRSSSDSSPSTFEHFPLIRNELNGLTIHSVESGILSRLLDESGGSLEGVMIQRHNEKDTLMILKV